MKKNQKYLAGWSLVCIVSVVTTISSLCPMVARSETKAGRYDFLQKHSANDLSYEQIVELVKSSRVRSVDALLPLLPKSFRSNFTFVRDSRSLQQTDKLYPRAMMFTPDGRLVCTFGGSPKLAGFQSLECYQYRKQTRSFDFREIQFPKAEDIEAEVLFSSANMRADNSMSCTACHGMDPRPNWDSYPLWPGLFGQNDDIIGGDFVKDTQEIADFLKFKKSINKKSRYAQLEFQKSEPYWPYRGFGNQNQNQKRTDNRPNLRYGVALQELLVERNTRIMLSLGEDFVREFLQRSTMFRKTNLAEHKVNGLLAQKIPVFSWLPNFRSYDPACRLCSGINERDFEYFSGRRPTLNEALAKRLQEELKGNNDIVLPVSAD